MLLAAPAWADDDDPPPAPLALHLRETLDLWRNTRGGLQVGDTQLNKLQLVADFNGTHLGLPGWTARLQYFRANGERLSGGRIGDVQTASNIEALSTDRLMEAWVARRFGRGDLKAGLIDLNAEFDSIGAAGLFLNSSHGIGPDLSKSGLDGPSIFPVSAPGAQARWRPSKRLSLAAAAFGGTPGDLAHPKAFAAARLSARDGALLIGQANWSLGEDARVALGAWRYTASFDRLDRPDLRQHGWAGTYAFVEGPLPVEHVKGWLRAGLTDRGVATVSDYLGGGLTREAPFASRPDDAIGLAVGRAGLGGPARRAAGLPAAETTVELTYRYQLSHALAVQPDLQYVRHPASRAGLPDALAVGLRLSFGLDRTFGAPADAPGPTR
ncbi:carbohydrate porin [Phenylobacterium soli]|uniref:carbohydrate porin n=1 Tax=Phenylobacterium soli TaxID=2170551 RepID=UPI0014024C16|nr:carbohydrate porin [Phenylobacterium soli]